MNIIRKAIMPLLGATITIAAAAPNSLTAQQPQQPDAQERPQVEDPIRQLNLSPEQREQIRAIRQQLQAERAVINQRLGETKKALDEALDASNPDEGLIEQRLRDLGAAQLAALRLRVISEVRIRRVLTPDQRITLRELQQQAQLLRRERQRDNLETRRQERVDRRRNQSNRRNGLGPLFPQRTLQEKTQP